MKNFGRVLRLALRYRLTFAASLICALMVGILWGANIGTVFPFLKVAFKGQSLQQWLSSEIDASLRTSAELTVTLDRLRGQLAAAGDEQQRRGIHAKINQADSRLDAEQDALRQYRRLQPYVNRYLPHDPFKTLVVLVGVLLVGTVIKDLFLIAHTILISRLGQLGTFELRKLFYRRTLQMELASFKNNGTDDLMSRFTYDMDQVGSGMQAFFGKLVREPLKMVACLVGAGCICWRLLLLSLLVAPLAGLLIQWLAKTLKRANRRAMEEMALLYNTLQETFRGIEIVKAFTMERHQRRRFHHNSKTFYKKAMRIARYNSLSRPTTEVMGILTISLALLAGAYLVIEGETHLLGIRMSRRPLSLESLLVFYGLLAGVSDPFRKLSDVFTRLQRAAAASDRIFAMLDRRSQIADPEHPRRLARHHRELTFEGVDFAYEPGQPVLEDVNLRIRCGETVAMVGPNGCGKSTLARLILRFADPTAGTIRLDGVPLTDVRLRHLRDQIGLVTQETMLFDNTVGDNIRYGSPQASDRDVVEAARQAHAHSFIQDELPKGYETLVGPAGSRLSGGQRQRIALARAILRDPAILILDEATSQIDLQSEQLIQKVLEEFVRNRTAVIITHHLALLRLADRIVVMQAGRILDVGTHDELLARSDFYRHLHRIHFDDLRQSA